MTQSPDTRAASHCYRHPNRQSWTLCQRCGRTVCGQCQTPAAVGVHCPECVRQARSAAPRRPSGLARLIRPGGSGWGLSHGLIGFTALVFVLQLLTGDLLTRLLTYYPMFTLAQPWTMISAAFAHASLIHLGLNMLGLYMLGPSLEVMLGRARFLLLYLAAAFGGSVAVLWLAPGSAVLGASGAVYGLFAAYFVLQRGLGGNSTGILMLIGLNLALGFFTPRISWQAHVGGLLIGGLVAFIYLRTRRATQRRLQVGLLSLVVVVLIAATASRFAL